VAKKYLYKLPETAQKLAQGASADEFVIAVTGTFALKNLLSGGKVSVITMQTCWGVNVIFCPHGRTVSHTDGYFPAMD